MKIRPKIAQSLWLKAAGFSLLLAPLLWISNRYLQRPPHTNLELTLFEGITYKRTPHSSPRPYVLHTITIDLTAAGIKPFVTPGSSTLKKQEMIARTAEEFVKEFKVQLAVNGSYFYPCTEETPWQYYPKSGDPVKVLGEAIAQGVSYSPPLPGLPTLCFDAKNQALITKSGNCPVGTVAGIAGMPLLLEQGVPVPVGPQYSGNKKNNKPYPRLVAAINRGGSKLWLIVIDGKQPLYSEGVTLSELTDILKELGADTALNLDGGGSTTLAMASGDGIRLLNAPIHAKFPMFQRPVANHLGFFARPITDKRFSIRIGNWGLGIGDWELGNGN